SCNGARQAARSGRHRRERRHRRVKRIGHGDSAPSRDHLRSSTRRRPVARELRRLDPAGITARADAHIPSRSQPRRAAQSVFGRNPVLFPNYYTPSWLTEGLAVYYESRFTSGGRLHGSFESAVVRSAAIDHIAPPLSELSLATSRFPYGQSVYVYGSFLWDDIAREHGASAI